MNKNGFIATSLIYSFFLIFVTLFLAIIADHLQDKVLLNTIEKGIKNNINNTMSIEDFEVGEMVSFVNDCVDVINNQWVIVNVNYKDKKVVFYSYDFIGNIPISLSSPLSSPLPDLNITHIESDIESNYKNNTYYNKILYTFKNKDAGGTSINTYSVGDNQCVSTNCVGGSSTGMYDFGKNCIITSCDDLITNTRKRLEISVNNNIYNKCDDTGDGVTILEV